MSPLNRRSFLATSALLCIPQLGFATETYPSKPIRLTTPNSAGSGADGMARRLGDHLGRALKQPVFVENLPGAGGLMGSENLLRSAPDGSTIGLISSNYVVFPHLYRKFAFDAVKDMTPVAGVASTPMVLVARADLPASNVSELKALALKSPGKLTLGSSGNGTILHLMGMYMQEKGQFTLTHVPYKGVAPVIPDLVSGTIDVAFFSYASVEGLVKQGRLKLLGVSSAKRSPAMPEVKTLDEVFPGCILEAWYAVIGPKGMPPEITQKLNESITAIVQSDSFKGQIAGEGAVPMPMAPDVLLAFMKSEYTKHGALVSRSGAIIQ
ncbi:tripartite tricarboxylate transporter substrate binding protein [Variovorax sp. E3]|uniref:Bug family tripartite tricarboxylate transporter substrate binding protein n=1 Tax=Variovorax sp. E3 TaxID=1914993 RepID=UPI0018DC1152|nr:tripartite tricarboxylate transporter substrate binding protein [Variovorax sp. E3]